MQVFSRCFTIKLSATPPPQVSNLEESQTRDTSPGDDDPGRLQSAGNLDSPNWWSGRHRCPPGFTGLFEGADHSPGSTAETSPPLPSGGLHFPSLHLLVTPERQTSDWPRPSLNAASSRKPVQPPGAPARRRGAARRRTAPLASVPRAEPPAAPRRWRGPQASRDLGAGG
ncbi:uncharacterized protein LOC119877537 isoform X2 [Canis lupus familiaris]|uniref:uncharacterized protein LOC119877537 isoform X2 n=1 Tax=Canis lupus familiaris TaxID=9615 RepID=UPI0018F63C6D|nr:uncharacterized protein LOC119877537 isoform X2 [Canis lupus familiaris]